MTPASADIYDLKTKAPGPQGSLPLTADMLLHSASGDVFGMAQNAGMGWEPSEVGRNQVLILSTQGGVRAPDGRPIALGYHTCHWEIGLLVQAAAHELRAGGSLPFAGFCSDPCDGRSQGTTGMFDSLAYRNDAALVLRRLIRSLPLRRAVMGVATCDKGHPAMMMALAAMHDLPTILVPGGVTLPPEQGEDAVRVNVRRAGKIESVERRINPSDPLGTACFERLADPPGRPHAEGNGLAVEQRVARRLDPVPDRVAEIEVRPDPRLLLVGFHDRGLERDVATDEVGGHRFPERLQRRRVALQEWQEVGPLAARCRPLDHGVLDHLRPARA